MALHRSYILQILVPQDAPEPAKRRVRRLCKLVYDTAKQLDLFVTDKRGSFNLELERRLEVEARERLVATKQYELEKALKHLAEVQS